MERTTPQNSDSFKLVTANELEHKKQECYAIRESLQQVNHSSKPLESTNPFNSGEFAAIQEHDERLYAEKNAGDGRHALNRDLVQQGEPSEHDLPISGEATRSSHPSNECSTTLKTSSRTQGRLPKQCRPSTERATLKVNAKTLKEVKVRPMGVSTDAPYTVRKEFVLTQSQDNFGFKLHIGSSHQKQKTPQEICMELNFDPGSDEILLCNITGLGAKETINVKQLPASPDSVTSDLGYMGKFALNVSSYSIYVLNERIFDITIHPRRYFSFFTDLRSQLRGTKKRALEPSSSQQDSAANKRAKVKETREESIYYSAPTHPLTDEPVTANSLSIVNDSNRRVVSGLCHPLEKLQIGGTVKIASATKKEDYELTRIADLSVQTNSLVYKASCSKIPELVVKIWRSKSDFDTNSTPGLNVSSVGKYWLNEVKVLSKIGRHHAIANFLGADARLLSIYLECIHAPNLQFYCEPGRNTYCTLDYSDVRRVFCIIVDALNFIHKQGFAHDDVKPANILYSKARGPVLIDFGWSSSCLTGKVGHCAGTPWYIPPEYRHSGERGRPGDVFALGVVMLFLLGRIPLPELQLPPLNWRISHLRGTNSTTKAMDEMNKWLNIVQIATRKLDQSPDLIRDKYVRDIIFMIQDTLDFRREKRITAGALYNNVQVLENPDYLNINLIKQD